MSAVGFKGFAKPAKVDADKAKGQLDNVSDDEFVMWTGGTYRARRASGRSACLKTVTEKMNPVPLKEYVQRCLKAGPNGTGFDTGISVAGLSLHQVAKPAVYLYLIRDDKGNYVAKTDIPVPDPSISDKPIKAGDIVVKAGSKAPAKRSRKTQAAKA